MPRRRRQRYGPWDRPVSALQAARFAHRWTAQEVADMVKLHCPGHGEEECKLEADKLGEYERGTRRPGVDHITALCKVYQKPAEELGLIVWRDQPAEDETATAAMGAGAPGTGGGAARAHPTSHAQQAAGAGSGGAGAEHAGGRHATGDDSGGGSGDGAAKSAGADGALGAGSQGRWTPTAGAVVLAHHDAGGTGEGRALVINGTNQTSIGYPGGDVASQLLTLSGHGPASPTLTGVAAPTWAEPEGSADVHRSTFIKGVGVAAGAVVTDPIIAIAQHTQAELAHTKVSPAQISHLTEAAYHHARNYYQLTQPDRLNVLLADWAVANRLLNLPATLRQRRDLFDAYARLSGILGFLFYEGGELARAEALLSTARAAAVEAGDGDLLAWLIDRSCLIPEHVERNPRRVLVLANQGLEAIGKGTILMSARLHARMACAHAELGDRPAALASLRMAEVSLESASPGCWPLERDTPRGFVYAPDLLAIDVGVTHLRLGDFSEAGKAAEEAAILLAAALGPRAAEEASAVPQNSLNLAIALAHTGEVEGACQIATDAVTRYNGVAKAVILRRARRFERALLELDQQPSAHSREFSELLRDRERSLHIT